MSIDEMSDQEKSVVLTQIANIDGLSVRHVPAKYSTSSDPSYDIDDHPAYDIVSYRTERGHVLIDVDLYDPDNMSLAWQVHLWVNTTTVLNRDKYLMFVKYRDWWEAAVVNCDIFHADFAPCAWLDKILELAIEAGMVGDE